MIAYPGFAVAETVGPTGVACVGVGGYKLATKKCARRMTQQEAERNEELQENRQTPEGAAKVQKVTRILNDLSLINDTVQVSGTREESLRYSVESQKDGTPVMSTGDFGIQNRRGLARGL